MMKNRFLRSFDFRFGRANLLKPSVLALLAANLYPVVGVVFLGWDAFYLLILFWMENLVIGFYTIIKMLLISRDNASWSAKLSSALFFCVHYGIFTLVHGVFIFVVFGGGLGDTSSKDTITVWQKVLNYQLLWGALMLLLSHGVSFSQNYIRAKEYKQSKVAELMQQPYGRVVILHLTIIFGGFLLMIFGSPVIGLIFLIVLKTVIDIRAHLQQHEKYSVKRKATI
jgi:hypothetical protein